MLRITLFGTPQITLDGHSLSEYITGRKLSLLVYLITTGRPHNRDVLADLLWSNTTNRRARKHLRDTLPTLRRYLNKYVISQGDTIAFNRKAPYWLDVEVFNSYANADIIRSNSDMLHEILDLYQDDFLRGFHVRNAPIFEEWLVQKREQLQKQMIEGLFFLANYYFSEKKYKSALSINTNLLMLEPWREDAHRLQMKLLMEDGQRQAALEQYDTCRKILLEEYDLEPLFETKELYEQIKYDLSSQLDFHHESDETSSRFPPLVNHSLINWEAIPAVNSFYGRDKELKQLEELVLTPSCQLVSLYGIVGQGKSTLAANLVQELALSDSKKIAPSQSFKYILWYSLIERPTVAELLRFFLQNLLPPEHQIPDTLTEQYTLLVKCLQSQRCLLILDHVEQVIPLDQQNIELVHEYRLYNELWRRVTQNTHKSCLMLLSRIQPDEITRLKHYSDVVQTFCLNGISNDSILEFFDDTTSQANKQEIMAWGDTYGGNPLGFTLLKETIQDLAPDEIDFYLSDEPILFESLQKSLDEQIRTLLPVEYDLLLWLTLIDKPVALKTLWYEFVDPYPKQSYLTAQRRLQHYGFLQQEAGQIRLNPLIRFYLTHRLVTAITNELITYQESNSVFDLFSLYLTDQKNDQLFHLFSNLSVAAFREWKKEQSTTLALLKRYRLSSHDDTSQMTTIKANASVLSAILSRLTSEWGINECGKKLSALLAQEQQKEHKERSYVEQNLNYLLSLLMFTHPQISIHQKKSKLAYIS